MINLAEIAAVREPILLQPVPDRDSAINEYRISLVAMLRVLQRESKRAVLAQISADRVFDGLTRDDESDPEGWFIDLARLAGIAVAAATERVRILLGRELESYTTRFLVTVRRGTGLQLPPGALGIDEEALRLLELSTARSAGLVQNVSDDVIAAVQRIAYDSRLNRATAARASKQLQDAFGIAKRRADLIAVDQIGTFHSSVTRMHQEAIGITAFAWQTQQDGRVRPLHRALSGNVYRHGEQTGAEGGLPPGGPIRCRCRALPVIVPPGERPPKRFDVPERTIFPKNPNTV